MSTLYCITCHGMTERDEEGRCCVHNAAKQPEPVISTPVVEFRDLSWHSEEPVAARPTQPQRELADWWLGLARREFDQTMDKAQEYGGDDLAYMGNILADCFNEKAHPQVNAAEIAIAFYSLGKITRIIGAYKDGRLPSDDSWLDLHVYAAMGIRAREVGGWPNGN
jgi:hypothetical protein